MKFINKLQLQLTLWYSAGLLIVTALVVVFFYWTVDWSFYRQTDDTLQKHLSALVLVVEDGAKNSGCGCVSRESPFLEGTLQMPGMVTAIFDENGNIIKSSEGYNSNVFNGTSYRVMSQSIVVEGKKVGQIMMGHTVEIYIKTREMLGKILAVAFLSLIIPILGIGYWLAKKAASRERQFITDMAHALKTPLAVLKTQIQDEKPTNQINKISTIINELLETEYNQNNKSVREFDLQELLTELKEITSHLDENKNIKIDSKFIAEKIVIRANKQKIAKAILAILENSINHGKKNGHIWIKLIRQNNRAVVEIKDDGIGISTTDLPHVFERLYRGIGLYLAKNLIETEGGSINLESVEGQGTTVTLTI